MTKRVYKTAQGKTVDLGALILQNENIRAVGNMNVNARGDLLDSTNQTIDQKNQQIQRQYRQTTSPGAAVPATGVPQPMKKTAKSEPVVEEQVQKIIDQNLEDTQAPASGLVAAMARSRSTKK
jgi:hypothetical protein